MTRAPSHSELQNSLAAHLRYAKPQEMVFTEVALVGSYGDHGRLDVVTLQATSNYTKRVLRGYEVKATKSDLIRDLEAEKWRRYESQVHRLYFAFPQGLVPISEIPPECGVLTLADGGWGIRRRASACPGHLIDESTWIRLAWSAEHSIRALNGRAPGGRHERLERMKQFKSDRVLASELSARYRAANMDLIAREAELDRRLEAVRGAEEAARSLGPALTAASYILRMLRDTIGAPDRPGAAFDTSKWGIERRDGARQALVQVAEQLSEAYNEATASPEDDG